MSYSDELGLMIQTAFKAGDIQISEHPSQKDILIKEDNSPVTEVDRRCEALIRESLLARFPNDSFLGEETGSSGGKTGRCWVVDPIDGTRPYIRGIPTYSVLIALLQERQPVCGVMHFPALKETYWAAKGSGAFCNGKPIRVSSTQSPDAAVGSALGFVEKQSQNDGKRVLSLMGKWDYSYGFMDAYSYACVAAGKLDVCVNLLDKPWDCAAGACIVEEAGGRFSDLKGKNTIFNNSIVLSNGIIHDRILEHFE